jgi:tRNA (Thr-GGU) A37 N-methylase
MPTSYGILERLIHGERETSHRPNPVGLTLVELLEAEGKVITIRALDAFDGTPILDIKPFDYWDTARDVRVPKCVMRLEQERLEKGEADK